MVTFNQFFDGLMGQESGGDFGAVNSRTGALGAYQILPGNVGPWGRQYLGRNISTRQFLNNPGLQTQLAKAVLHSYWDKYGARGAASAWYSGSPRGANNYTRFRSDEPSIGEYVDGVLERARKSAGASAEMPFELVQNTKNVQSLAAETEPELENYAGLSGYGMGLQSADEKEDDNSSLGSAAGDSALGLTTPVGAMDLDGDGIVQEEPIVADEAGDPRNLGTPRHVGNATRQAVIDFAREQLGTPYVWGGESKGALDCSGLVQLAFKMAGISMPRVSYQQINMGKKTPISQLQPGDLIGWDYSSRNDGADHIAIYLGNNRVIEAPAPGLKVRVHDLYNIGSAKPFGVSISNLYGGN